MSFGFRSAARIRLHKVSASTPPPRFGNARVIAHRPSGCRRCSAGSTDRRKAIGAHRACADRRVDLGERIAAQCDPFSESKFDAWPTGRRRAHSVRVCLPQALSYRLGGEGRAAFVEHATASRAPDCRHRQRQARPPVLASDRGPRPRHAGGFR